MNINIVEIYYIIDEFCKDFDKLTEGYRLPVNTSKKRRNRAYSMSDSEIITIMILSYQSHCRDLKFFYLNHVKNNCRSYFPQTVSYNRFVELQQKALVPMVIFLQMYCLWVNVPAFHSLTLRPSASATSSTNTATKYSRVWPPRENLLSAGSWDLNFIGHKRQGGNHSISTFPS